MLASFYFSEEWDLEEKNFIVQKTIYYMKKDDLPDFVQKPERFLYGEDGACIGYSYQKPEGTYLSLKELFQPEQMRQFHIDSSFLLQLAEKIWHMMQILEKKEIYSGFLGLDYIMVDPNEPFHRIWIKNPELFQAGELPSSHVWYPSDAKLFEDEFELFTAKSQRLADAKLIYKILTASVKGNAKIPPNPKMSEDSWMFWNILSKEWKDFFVHLAEEEMIYEKMEEMFAHAMNEEGSFDPGKRNTTSADEKKTVDICEKNREEWEKKKAYAMILLLRQAEKSSHDISRQLYLLQEKLEADPKLDYEQAFVLGDRHVYLRPFSYYPKEYRSQLPQMVAEYSFGEAMILSADLLESALKREERPSALYILLDGEIKNDKIFQIGLKKLEKLTKNWYTKLVLFSVSELRGEGYQKLEDLCRKGQLK